MFGEELTFWALDLLPAKLAFTLNKWNIPTCIFIGKYFTFMPDWNMDLTIVVGKSLQLPPIAQPSAKEVDEHHAAFISAYKALFEMNKEKYAATGKEAVLEIL